MQARVVLQLKLRKKTAAQRSENKNIFNRDQHNTKNGFFTPHNDGFH